MSPNKNEEENNSETIDPRIEKIKKTFMNDVNDINSKNQVTIMIIESFYLHK
jgi:hypothetical protein